jgi:hypothetical protein
MGWKMGSFVGDLTVIREEGFRQDGTGARAAASRRTSERVVSVVIIYSSTYTGGVARLVAQMRSAKIENRVFGEITRKKILFLWFFLILSVARLVTGWRWRRMRTHGRRIRGSPWPGPEAYCGGGDKNMVVRLDRAGRGDYKWVSDLAHVHEIDSQETGIFPLFK